MLITIGYKNKTTTIVRAALAILLGVLLLSVDNISTYITQFIGVVIIVAGLVSALPAIPGKNRTVSRASQLTYALTCGIAVLVGLLFILKPAAIHGLLFMVFAGLLILFGALEILVLVSTYLFLVPGSVIGWLPLVLGGGAVIFAILFFVDSAAFKWCLAVGLIVYGVSELISLLRLARVEKEYEIRFPAQEEKAEEPLHQVGLESPYAGARDVDFESVDKQ